MLKSFSEELTEDREFEIGGETFRFRIIHWTEAADLLDGKGPDNDVQREGNGQISYRVDTEFAIKEMPKYLDPADDSVKRWKALVARKDNPVPRHQIVQAFSFARLQSLGLPTTTPSSELLEDGAGNAEAGSSDESLSTEATSTA